MMSGAGGGGESVAAAESDICRERKMRGEIFCVVRVLAASKSDRLLHHFLAGKSRRGWACSFIVFPRRT